MKYFQSYFSHNKGLKKFRSAFTLVEAMVVLAVLVAVLGLSTIGIVRFRDSLELQNGYSDVVSYLGTIQNRARNSIAYSFNGNEPYVPQFYSLYFANDDFSLLGCEESSLGIADCISLEVDIKSSAFQEVTFSLEGSCNNDTIIGFKRSSIDIVRIEGPILRSGDLITGESLNIVNSGDCSLIVGHASLSSEKRIDFNLGNNTVNLEDT